MFQGHFNVFKCGINITILDYGQNGSSIGDVSTTLALVSTAVIEGTSTDVDCSSIGDVSTIIALADVCEGTSP